MKEYAHHTVSSVLAIHDEVLAAHGGLDGVKDRGLLESAIAVPQASFSGEPFLKDLHEMAAAYLYHICQNHPFNDGNKRTALATALVFLAENGALASDTELDVDQWEGIVLGVASGVIGKEELAQKMRESLPV